jgi:hypothetical protein
MVRSARQCAYSVDGPGTFHCPNPRSAIFQRRAGSPADSMCTSGLGEQVWMRPWRSPLQALAKENEPRSGPAAHRHRPRVTWTRVCWFVDDHLAFEMQRVPVTPARCGEIIGGSRVYKVGVHHHVPFMMRRLCVAPPFRDAPGFSGNSSIVRPAGPEHYAQRPRMDHATDASGTGGSGDIAAGRC